MDDVAPAAGDGDEPDRPGRLRAATRSDDATVHLRLRGRIDEDALTSLRQQLATCLSSGVLAIRIHAEEQDDLGLETLQALSGVAHYLRRRGGRLTLVGAQPRVLTRLAIHELEHLLPLGAVGRTATDAARARGAVPAPKEKVT